MDGVYQNENIMIIKKEILWKIFVKCGLYVSELCVPYAWVFFGSTISLYTVFIDERIMDFFGEYIDKDILLCDVWWLLLLLCFNQENDFSFLYFWFSFCLEIPDGAFLGVCVFILRVFRVWIANVYLWLLNFYVYLMLRGCLIYFYFCFH